MSAQSEAPRAIDSLAKAAQAQQIAESFSQKIVAETYGIKRRAVKASKIAKRHRSHVRVYRSAPDPTSAAVNLVQKLREDLFVPLLASETAAAFQKTAVAQFSLFCSTMNKLASWSEMLKEKPSPEAVLEGYFARVRALLGVDAEEEFRFDVATYRRAGDLASRLSGMSQLEDGDTTAAFASQFQVQSALHNMGVIALMELSCGTPYTALALDQAFDLARGGALRAYSSARSAYDLLHGAEAAESQPEEFDREDAHLAGLRG